VSPRILSVAWARGASPEAMTEAFGEEALQVAVLEALLDDPERRLKVAEALGVPQRRDPLLTR